MLCRELWIAFVLFGVLLPGLGCAGDHWRAARCCCPSIMAAAAPSGPGAGQPTLAPPESTFSRPARVQVFPDGRRAITVEVEIEHGSATGDR